MNIAPKSLVLGRAGRWKALAGGLCVAGIVLAQAEPPAAVPPHPLLVASLKLYQRKMFESCERLRVMAAGASGLTDDDQVLLHLLAAMLVLRNNDEDTARKEVALALQIDRTANAPQGAPFRISDLLEEQRLRLPPEVPSPTPRGKIRSRSRPQALSPEEKHAAAQKAASQREPAPKNLLEAVDALCAHELTDRLEAANIVLQQLRASSSLSLADRVNAEIRRGVIWLETFEEKRARESFREALEMDPNARLPGYVSPNVRRTFEEVRFAVAPIPPPTPEIEKQDKQPPLEGPRLDSRWIMVGGGTAALIGGAVLVIHPYSQKCHGAWNPTGGMSCAQANTELAIGWPLGAAGALAVSGGLLGTLRPKLWPFQMSAEVWRDGGLIVVGDRF